MSQFDLRKVSRAMEESVGGSFDERQEVGAWAWLRAYGELNRLFPQLGMGFGFVERDVRGKLEELEAALREAGEGDEARAEVWLSGRGGASFVRLHRALEFVVRVVWDIFWAEDEEKLGPIVRKSYDETLAKFHGRLIRGLVHAACLTLGRRRELRPVLLGHLSDSQARPVVQAVYNNGGRIHARTQAALQRYPNIANLPS